MRKPNAVFWLLMCVVFLSGCSASSRIVRTYDGEPLAADQVARLLVPSDIKLMEVDGVAQKEYLLDNLALTYELKPGPHRLVYRYTAIWSKPGGGEDAPKVDVIESSPRQVEFVFKPGVDYTLSFERPESRAQAFAMAPRFSASLADVGGRTLVRDQAYQAPVVALAAAGVSAAQGAPSAVAPLAGGSPDAAAGGVLSGPATGGLPRLDALKLLWEQASPEDKKEFLRWAFQ